jgi:uncharacterized protein DUF2510
MTDAQTPATPSIPAGWYQDPSNASLKRWWDGTQWTEQVSAPYVQAAQQTAPDGTNGNTPWIWLYIFLPLLGVIPLFTIDTTSYIDDALNNPGSSSSLQSQLAIYTQPAFVITSILSWVLIAVTIVLAYLDFRELKKRGVPAPFHWAFGFLSLAGLVGYVYSIGRGVVTKRRIGKGYGIVLASILAMVAYIVAIVVYLVIVFNQVFAAIAENPGLVQ